MPAPTALQSLVCSTDNWGGNIFLEWIYPATLPTNWQLYIFKKSGEAVTDQQIIDYFAGSLNDQTLKTLGIYIYRELPALTAYLSFTDWGVEDGKDYYYKGLIRDKDTNTNSAAVTTHIEPDGNIIFKIPDTKNLLIRAIEKAISSVKNASGDTPVLGKHFKVNSNYPRDKAEALYIVVSRLPGQSALRYFSEVIAEYQDQIVRGQADIDVLEIAWVATGNPAERDKVTLLMRGYQQILHRYLMKMGGGDIYDVRFVMGGDSESAPNAEAAVRGTMTAIFVVETKVQVGGVEIGQPITVQTAYIGE